MIIEKWRNQLWWRGTGLVRSRSHANTLHASAMFTYRTRILWLRRTSSLRRRKVTTFPIKIIKQKIKKCCQLTVEQTGEVSASTAILPQSNQVFFRMHCPRGIFTVECCPQAICKSYYLTMVEVPISIIKNLLIKLCLYVQSVSIVADRKLASKRTESSNFIITLLLYFSL